MAEAKNCTKLRSALEACTHGDVDALPALFTDAVSGWSPNMLVESCEELAEVVSERESAFSDVEIHVDAIDAFGNKAVAEYRLTARFTGPFESDDVALEPNGHLIVLGAAIVAEFDGDKIKAFRNYFDEAAMIGQMVLPG